MNILYKSILIASLIACIGGITSCDDMLRPNQIGVQTVDATFTDFSGSMAAVNGLYGIMNNRNWFSNCLLQIDQASDDVTNGSILTAGYSAIDYFELVEDNSISYNLWDGFYKIIYRANVIIERVPQVKFATLSIKNSAGLHFTDQFLGEAYFMRAFSYYNMVRLFGDVPLHLKEIKSTSEINIPRSSSSLVYTAIISDLENAAELLPPTYSNTGKGNEKGRVSKWSAKALLADVYLTLKQYEKAKLLALEIVQNSNRKLVPNYSDLFAKGDEGKENCDESLFEIQYANGGATVGIPPYASDFSYLMGQNPDPITGLQNQGSYRPTNNLDSDQETGFTGGLVQDYEAGDGRFAFYFKQIASTGIQRYLTDKYFVAGTSSAGNTNFTLLRLAEVYLIYAESVNELGAPDAIAYNLINNLRRRAFGKPMDTVSSNDLVENMGQNDFRDAVRLERRRELAMENKRWFDLCRYGFDYANKTLKINQKRNKFTIEKMLFPIPRTELIANPLLTQNPGY